MLEQVSNFDQEISFILGFAGSGKSTRLAKMADATTLVLTPTHKAAGVLQEKGVVNVYTIHSVLKLVPTLNQNFIPGKQRMQKLKKIGETNLDHIKTVFIDEFSMINQEILDLLLTVLPATCKVVIFGDPFQLPPVDGEPIDPELYTDNIEELTVQHRSEAPHIVETFMRFMQYIKDGSETNLTLNKNIKKGTLDGFNPATDRALAFTNNKVLELNTQISSLLGLDTEFAVGDSLLANSLTCEYSEESGTKLFPSLISKGKIKLDNQEGVLKEIEKFNSLQHIDMYPQCSIVVGGEVYEIYYDMQHYQTQKELKKAVEYWQDYVYKQNNIPEEINLASWCKDNKGAPGVKERARAWSMYLAHSNLVFSLQRPFATTVHKSQGSEFSTIYLAQNDIKQSIMNNYYLNYARLMYVALSRAIHNVIIVD